MRSDRKSQAQRRTAVVGDVAAAQDGSVAKFSSKKASRNFPFKVGTVVPAALRNGRALLCKCSKPPGCRPTLQQNQIT
jgi:hypothetical protein